MRLALAFITAFVILAAAPGRAQNNGDYGEQHREMTARLRSEYNIESGKLLRALATVPRHRFVPSSYDNLAYTNTTIPLGKGLTAPSPGYYTRIFRNTDRLEDKRVLILGFGTGYAAALLSRIADSVFVIEYSGELASQYETTFSSLGYSVNITESRNRLAWAGEAPFDFIFIHGAVRRVPTDVINLLAPEGVLLFSLANRAGFQFMVRINRVGELFTIEENGESFLPLIDTL
jgi:protein-L-isoaspartate(D-aspartate) O-methyltransferase